MTENVTQISTKKKIAFSLVIFLFSMFIILLLELFLRVVNYGGDINLILTKKINGTNYCYINKKVAKRFFSFQDISIPDARIAVFKKEKSANTYRIFCLGGSTTAGFPYEFNGTFPSLLKDRLDILFPTKDIEVINVGISAINSYSVLDFTKELVNYEPDLFLIYMGHNEFYGALGIGSTQQVSRNRNWILFYMKFQKMRTFNLMRNIVKQVIGLVSSKPAQQIKKHTLMERVIKDQYIKYNSELYEIARNYFEKNLADIFSTAQRSGVKIIASTLVCNLADQEPFGYQLASNLSQVKIDQWKKYIAAGYEFEKINKYEKALIEYNKANQIDSSAALLNFRRAKCLQLLGNKKSAYRYFVKARDYDVMRFRASSDFNEIIRKVGKVYQVPVVEMEKVFAPFCQDNIMDRNLFTDHLHPNFKGYMLMAKAFSRAMPENSCIVDEKSWNWELDKSDHEYLRMAGVTDLDLEIANQRIKKLTKHFPFKKQIVLRKITGSEYEKLLAKTVADLNARKFGWNEAHYRIAKYFLQKKEWENAAREYEAVIKIAAFNYFPYIELANVQMRQKKFDQAEKNLKTALLYSGHLPYANAKLGMLYFFTDRPQLSIKQIKQAIKKDRHTKRFKKNELAGAFYILGMAYARTGAADSARTALTNSLDLNPTDLKVQEALKKLDRAASK